MEEFVPKELPLNIDFESKNVLKKLVEANKALAELKGTVKIIPNRDILINSLVLQEAKDSSEIENIVTTHDELYRANIDNTNISSNTKEVKKYESALRYGFKIIEEKEILTIKDIVDIQKIIGNEAGIRKQAGTNLKNDKTGEIVYTPPQNYQIILDLLNNLEKYINNYYKEDVDPLIKMAIIHYQFESIHPFYDGNGRVGRIINILYLVKEKLLDLPILYLSYYIINNKEKYYNLLKELNSNTKFFSGNFEKWITFNLEAIKEVSQKTILLVNNIKTLMDEYKKDLREKEPSIYSKDLIEVLFSHPYTTINILEKKLNIHRETASKYLTTLSDLSYLNKIKIGRSNYYVNKKLWELLKKGLN